MAVQDAKKTADSFFYHVKDYAENFRRLTMLKITRKAVDASAISAVAALLLILSLFFLVFASAGLAWWLGNLVNSRAGGFFLVSFLYLMLVTALLLTRRKTIIRLKDLITRTIYEKKDS